MPRQHWTRTQLLLAGGGAVAGFAVPAARAGSEEDAALLRLAAAAELVLGPYLYRALGSRRFDAGERGALRAARLADQRHYTELVAAIGPDAPTAADFEIAFPARAFATREAAVALGLALERTAVGIYLTLSGALGEAPLRALAGRLGAAQATHLSLLSTLAGRGPVAAPQAVGVERATELLAPYWG